MSFHHQVTFKCDACDLNWTIDEDSMELPPGWLGLQIIVADTEGCIPEHEQELYCHFCSQECLVEYTAGDDLRRRLCLADKDMDDVMLEDLDIEDEPDDEPDDESEDEELSS